MSHIDWKDVLEPVGYIIAALIALLSAWLVARRASKTSKEATAVEFATKIGERLDKALDRLDAVEAKLDLSEAVTRSAVGYIERLIRWARTHIADVASLDPMPLPPSDLHDYLPDDIRQERAS